MDRQLETETRGKVSKSHETRRETETLLIPLWASRETLCATLGISRATFYRRVKAGAIEVQKVDGETRYHVVSNVRLPVRKSQVEAETRRETETETRETEPVLELTSVIAEPDPLVAQLRELVTRNGQLERERAEAVTIGHWLADEKEQLSTENARLKAESATLTKLLSEAVEVVARANDDARRLHSVIDGLVDGVADVSSDWKAVPIRGRLRSILAGI
jgi:hypothetical protein